MARTSLQTLVVNEDISDADAIKRVLSGNRDSFEILVLRYQQMVYATVWTYLRDTTLAEDATQEAFLTAIQHLKSVRNPNRFGPWLYRISRNIAIRAGKKISREKAALEAFSREQPCESPSGWEDAELDGALETLPQKAREALLLFYVRENKIADCARYLGISETAFKTRLHRARERLKSQLAQQTAIPPEGVVSSPDLTRKIMGVLPVTGLWSKAGPLSWATMPGLFFTAPAFIGMWVSYRAQMANFRTHVPIRRMVAQSNALPGGLLVLIGLVIILGISKRFGEDGMHLYGGLLLLITNTLLLRNYHRLQRTPYVGALSIGGLLIGAVWLLIGLGILRRSYSMLPFYVYNILLFATRKSWPMRNDYNLFQRHCMGLLSPEQAVMPTRLTQDQIQRFSYFLGSQLLASDRVYEATGCRLYLPRVKRSFVSMGWGLGFRWSKHSYVDISYDGQCRAYLCPADQKALISVYPEAADTAALEAAVARAVATSLLYYTEGNLPKAAEVLTNESDAQTFYKSMDQLHGLTIILYVGLIAAFLGIGLFVWQTVFPGS